MDTRSTDVGRLDAEAVEELKAEVVAAGNLPRHVAVIMDGNGRWARRKGLVRIQGHHAARKAVREVVEAAAQLELEALTLYTFSIENWNRPKAEVDALMRFLKDTLKEERDELARNNVRLSTIGRIGDLPASVRDELESTIDFLSGSTGLVLTLAISYGGRAEIVDAMKGIAKELLAGRLAPDAIDEDVVQSHLYAAELPPPDLLIRTSGEMRISNFLLWGLAYSEIYVTDVLWPDIRRAHFYAAIRDYQGRERRFGRVD